MSTPANYVFLPWVRQGAAAGIETPDNRTGANQAAVVSVSVALRVNNVAPDVQRQVRLYGPGDVVGIDPQQVVRTEPRHLSTDFEPNYFPAVEFDRPDFPWLFTPAKADSQGILRPWICLVVVKKQNGVSVRVDRNLPLPVLEIKREARPDRELPNLSESWAWAHAQVAGAQPQLGPLKSALAGDPALTVSRLLCPRLLEPLSDYIACVVPAFEQGRRAGLGEPLRRPEEQAPLPLAPAWAFVEGSPADVQLPIYFRWEFRTGTGGDFESLAALLRARPIPDTVGKRQIDLSEPGFIIQPPPDPTAPKTLGLEGALRLVGSKSDEWKQTVRLPFQKALQQILTRAWEVATDENHNHDPIVGPPVYGAWQAARHVLQVTEPPTMDWLDALNLDPRNRVAAAFGTQVIQAEQEELMASAWDQLGQGPRVNQIKRQAQLGIAVNKIYINRHFNRFSDDTLLKVLAPAQSRLVVERLNSNDRRSFLSQKFLQAAIPASAVSAPLRRLTNSRGVVAARFAARSPVAASAPSIMHLSTFAVATFAAAAVLPPKRTGPITLDAVTDSQPTIPLASLKDVARSARIRASINSTPTLEFSFAQENVTPKRTLLNFAPAPDNHEAQIFRTVAAEHQDYLNKLFSSPPPDPTAAAKQLNMFDTGVRDKLLQSIKPEVTITARVLASVASPDTSQHVDDPLETNIDDPVFPQPMYEALRDLSQDLFLPNLADVPANTVALLETNSTFVESFMVGLNAEMSSELLWRNYPTNQRGTYFKQFWDTSVDPSADANNGDMEAIAKWGNKHLGDNMPHTSGTLVLLIRGELLRRYPNTVIYAAPAEIKLGVQDLLRKVDAEKHPIFRGTLKPDVTFIGFDLTEKQALGNPPNDPGWYFVIQQQPTEPRFGLDVGDFATQPPQLVTWDDLSWRNFADSEEELKAHPFASTSKTFAPIAGVQWGKNAAQQAFITLQRPMRIAIHAQQMIQKSHR